MKDMPRRVSGMTSGFYGLEKKRGITRIYSGSQFYQII